MKGIQLRIVEVVGGTSIYGETFTRQQGIFEQVSWWRRSSGMKRSEEGSAVREGKAGRCEAREAWGRE
jgi:hypothetical protein